MPMTTIDEKLTNALNIFCVNRIWNEPTAELRVNAGGYMISERSVASQFTDPYGRISDLPTNKELYYVFVLQRVNVHGLIKFDIPKNMWISSVDVCNLYNTLLNAYLPSGKIFSKSKVYIKWSCEGSMVYVAIQREHALKVTTPKDMINTVFNLYRDSDIVNDMIIYPFSVDQYDTQFNLRTLVWNKLLELKNSNIPYNVFINGYEIRINNMNDIPLNSDIDILADENVKISFTINLDDPNQNHTFFSTKDNMYKQIVHIPKELNPDYWIYTHNTIEIYVRNNKTNEGVWVHRSADRGVTQLTFNDIGIARYIIDNAKDVLDTDGVSLHVTIRRHDNNNYMIRDKNYLDLLYMHHTDKEILDIYTGKLAVPLYFWRIDLLEQSTFTEFLEDVPHEINTKNISKHIDGLGYYHTASLLCERIINSVITNWFTGTLHLPKPYLFSDTEVFPIIYLNGFKVNWEELDISEIPGNKVSVTFKNNLLWRVGDILTAVLFTTGKKDVYQFTPTEGNFRIRLPYSNPVFVVKDTSTKPTTSYTTTHTENFERFTDLIGNIVIVKVTDNEYEYSFGPRVFDKEFYIFNNFTTYTYTESIDNAMSVGDPLTVELTTKVKDTYEIVPLPEELINTTMVYLNNHFLIKGIDYQVMKYYDSDNKYVKSQIVLQNMKYLKEQLNKVEIFTSNVRTENTTYGFVIDDIANTNKDDITLYFKTFSTFHVDGRMEYDVTNRGTIFDVPSNRYDTGVPFEVNTSLPQVIREFLDKYHSNDDKERIKLLNDYFYTFIDDRPDEIILDELSYQIYSPHMAKIINDIIENRFIIGFDPDISNLPKMLKEYQKYYDNDVCHQEAFNKHFIDVFPHYRQFILQGNADEYKYKIIHALVKLILPNDNITSGNNVYP